VCRAILWLFVILYGIEIGAGLFEMRVLVPRWAASPPESVWRLYELNQSYPELATDAGGRFWMFSTPLLGLLALVLLIACRRTRGTHRRLLLTSTMLTLIVVAATFVYFVPSIMVFAGSPAGVNGPQIAAMANRWVALSWLRFVVYMIGWICALRALTLDPMAE
jgi:hypothetical protein